MPTYEYKCVDCGNLFEDFASMSSDPVKECPSCKGHVQRLISAGSGLIFKGSGFYITDYKKVKGDKAKPKPTPKNDKKKEAA